jgi:hypothetical protein
MAKSSLARSGHQSNPEYLDARVLRGQRLFKERAAAFIWKRGSWFVPSENGCSYYAVRLGPVEVCECADYELSRRALQAHSRRLNRPRQEQSVFMLRV